ncbi:hypothetical protein [Paraburkholderia tropica]|nr:hypothetical protein [Paraburkholderia tropica]
MKRADSLEAEARAMLAQQDQAARAGAKLGEIGATLDALQHAQSAATTSLDDLIAQAERAIATNTAPSAAAHVHAIVQSIEIDIDVTGTSPHSSIARIDTLESIRVDREASWEAYMVQVESYCARQRVQGVDSPFQQLMTPSQRVAFERRVEQDFAIRNARCDKYDYMIAGTCGLIGGLIDILLVGAPGEGLLTRAADDWTDSAVQKFARLVGWKGPKEGSDPTHSAIGFLEGKYKVNYDHRHGVDVGGAFKMSTKNHHIKSLGHSPDLVGLFFSILDQFCSTAHFVSDGKLISIDTDTFELRGGTFAAKLFAGFANWLGHLFSDVAGSSGAQGRGSGIPIPFYSLLQFVNVGEFGQHRQTFATVAVQVFERGYDMRHGIAMSIPVIVAELFTRLAWTVKQRCYHERPWRECLPVSNAPELRRMLLVAHGTLCIVDATDAGLRSGGEMIQFLLRSNLIAWARFGSLALREVLALVREGQLDHAAVDEYLDAEYRRMLVA